MKLPVRRSADTQRLSVLVPAPTVPLRAQPPPDPEPLAGMVFELRPLDAAGAKSLRAAMCGESNRDEALVEGRLANVRVAQRHYAPDTEAVVRFEHAGVTIMVDPHAPPHVHARLVDIAPFLSVAAVHLTHSGALPVCLLDDGAPGHLSFCGGAETLLIPDVYFWSTQAYHAARDEYRASPGWQDRLDSVLWRGSTTGYTQGDWSELPRAKMCLIASKADAKVQLDVGFTEVVQLSSQDESEIRSQGLMRDRVPSSEYANYRYHIDIDGNTNSWSGLFCKLLSGGLVFKVEPAKGDCQWYYPRLQAWRHYIPIKKSLEDLEEKIFWARNHEGCAEQIAACGRRLASSLTLASEADYARAVIETALSRNATATT